MRFIFIIAICCSISVHVSARQKKYEFNTRCQQAYDAIMQLRLNTGKAMLEEENAATPITSFRTSWIITSIFSRSFLTKIPTYMPGSASCAEPGSIS